MTVHVTEYLGVFIACRLREPELQSGHIITDRTLHV